MVNKKSKTLVITAVSIAVFLCVLVWKWPHPLLSHFNVQGAPGVGGVILFRNDEEVKQVELDNGKDLEKLWTSIKNTRLRHIGGYKIMTIENSLYLVRIQMWEDGKVIGSVAFDCGSDGYVYLGNSKYELYGSSDMISILETFLY